MQECYTVAVCGRFIRQYRGKKAVIRCRLRVFEQSSISLGGSKNWDSTVS